MKLASGFDLLKRGWEVYTANFKRYTLWGFLFLLLQILGQYAQGALVFSFLTKYGVDLGAEELALYIPWMSQLQDSLGGTGLMVFGIVTGIIFGVAMLYMFVGMAFNSADMFAKKKDKSLGEYLKMTTPMFWPLILVGIITTIAIVLGFILLIIPGIIFSVWYMYASYEVIFSKKKGMEALRSSKGLVHGRFWPVLWRLFVIYLVIMVVSMVFALAMGIADTVLVSMFGAEMIWLSVLLFLIPNLFLVPYSFAIQYALYEGLQASKGGSSKTVKPEDLAPAA